MLILRSVLICLVNVSLNVKSALYISQFARRMVGAIYYTAEGLEISDNVKKKNAENKKSEI